MLSAQQVRDRVQYMRMRSTQRDRENSQLIAIRKGDYEAVAPGLFNTSEFDEPLVANLIDTTARDIAEVMAPLPSVDVQPLSLDKAKEQERADLRQAIANSYIQYSRLQDQMFAGADRYNSWGFMAFIAEPDYREKHPVIRIGDNPTAYYAKDYRGKVKQYAEVVMVEIGELCHRFPELELENVFRARYGDDPTKKVEVIRWYDDHCQRLICADPCVELVYMDNITKCCPVRIVERPALVTGEARGQFHDVIWVQIARALVQVYTLDALEQSVHAPVAAPKDVNEIDIGPLTVIQSDNPEKIGRVNLNITPGLFPEFQTLAQEQRVGSRYPEGRSGNIDASIITGQGMQALMGTFDTQVQTFQRLNASALEDVVAMCFEIDEALWGSVKKTRIIKDNGAPRKFTYTPAKDIDGNHVVDVSYGAIAGLDPNRGLVFVLQALAGGLLSKQTAMKSLPVDMNPQAETRQIELEKVNDSVSAALTQLPLAIPMMTTNGADPREIVTQIAEAAEMIQKGKSPVEAIKEIFAPKEQPQPEPSPLEMAQGAGEGPAGLPGIGGGGASDLLMSLAGMTPSGKPNLQANVSRMRPAQG